MNIFSVADSEGREQTFENIKKVLVPTLFIGIAQLPEHNEIWTLETTADIEEVKRYYRTIHSLNVPVHLFRIGELV
jgi:hypothetical protein